MLKYKNYNQKLSDKFGVSLMRFGTRFDTVKYRKNFNLKFLYSSKLSDNYRFPKGIIGETLNLEGLTVECISRKSEETKFALIQLHGGAYVLDFNDTYRKSAEKYLSMKSNLKVFSPIYSLAPKHPYPQALNEAVRVYKYLITNGYKPKNIILAGDSAGGGLAIATTLYLRDNSIPLPRAIITMSAWTNLAMNGKSHEENKHVDPLFGEGTQPLNIKAYTKRHSVLDPYISPRYGDFSKFTDMLMFVGGDEIIESDTLDVAELAKENNEVIVYNFLGMFHAFPFGFNKMSSSRKAWKIVKEYMNEKLRG
ncbi:alpha/beta hydrolase fold domain-containing protein [Mycoplasmatota bacterium WC30]